MKKLLFLSAVSLAALSPKAEAPIIQDTLQSALHNSADLQIANANVHVEEEGKTLVHRELFPQITFNAKGTAGFGEKKVNNPTSRPGKYRENGQENSGSMGLTLGVGLYEGGMYWANLEKAEHDVAASKLAFESTAQSSLFNALKVYADLQAARSTLAVVENAVVIYEQQLKIAEVKYKVGDETIAAVESMRAKLEQFRSRGIAAKAEVATQEATFIRVVGKRAPKNLMDVKLPDSFPISLKHALEIAEKDNLDVKIQKEAAAAAKASVRATYGKNLLPKLQMGFEFSRKLSATKGRFDGMHVPTKKTRENELGISATLSIPLDYSGGKQAGVRQARYAAAKERLKIVEKRREQLLNVAVLWQKYQRDTAQIKQYVTQIKSAKVAMKAIEQQYKAGVVTYLNLIEAQQEELEAQNGLITSRRDALLSGVQLMVALGIFEPSLFNVEAPQVAFEDSFWGTAIPEFALDTQNQDPVIGELQQFAA